MKQALFAFMAVLSAIFFIGCDNTNPKQNDASPLVVNKNIDTFDSIYKALLTKYNAIDVENLNYTYELQKLMDSNKKVIIFKNTISDIYKNGDNYELKFFTNILLKGTAHNKLIPKINISSILFSNFKKKLDEESDLREVIIVMKVNDLKTERGFVLNGNVIDYYFESNN